MLNFKFFWMLIFCLLVAHDGHSVPHSRAVDQNQLLGLAAILINNQDYDKAEQVLAQVMDPNLLKTSRYFRIKALLALAHQQWLEAEKLLLKAIKARTPEEPKDPLYYSLAQVYFQSEQYEKCIQTLTSILGESERPTLLKAMSYWKLGDSLQALTVLNEGMKKQESSHLLSLQKMIFYIELGLTRTAKSEAVSYLKSHGRPEDFIVMASSFQKQKSLDAAQDVLFLGAAIFSEHEDLHLHLARVYYEKGDFLSASRVFLGLANIDPSYLVQAVELMRESGQNVQASYFAQQIRDPKDKFKQYLALFLKEESYERVLSLEEDLKRWGLFSDDEVLYSLVYARLKTGQGHRVPELVEKIQNPELFAKAQTLIHQIQGEL